MFTSGSGRFIQNITPIQNIQTSVTGNSTASQIANLQASVASLITQVANLTAKVSTLTG